MSIAPVLLPVASYSLIWWLVSNYREVLGLRRLSWRGTGVTAFLGFQALLAFVTECLSVGQHLTSGTTLSAWLIINLVVVGLLVRRSDLDIVKAQTRALWSAVCRLGGQPVEVRIGFIVLVAILSALGTTAWLYLPSNGDSLVYHLARVAHWEQQSSVAHFATHYTAQIELAPLHEFNMLHMHLLTGSDRLDGYVQLFAFVMCVLGAAEVARLLGAQAAVQVAAALIFAVVPSAVLEATSTQNNIFAAACGIGLVVLLLAWVPLGRWVSMAATLGLGTGLAILAKGTLPPLIGPVMGLLAGRLVFSNCGHRRGAWSFDGRRWPC